MGNDLFYYDHTGPLSITIPTGTYTLLSFNRYLAQTTTTSLYKVVLSLDGTQYEVWKYANESDRNNDKNGVKMNVDNLSTLNNEIKSGLVWVERIKLNSDIINNGTNDSTGI